MPITCRADVWKRASLPPGSIYIISGWSGRAPRVLSVPMCKGAACHGPCCTSSDIRCYILRTGAFQPSPYIFFLEKSPPCRWNSRTCVSFFLDMIITGLYGLLPRRPAIQERRIPRSLDMLSWERFPSPACIYIYIRDLYWTARGVERKKRGRQGEKHGFHL